MNFGTKAETLKLIEAKLPAVKVLPLVFFTQEEWQNASQDCLDRVVCLQSDRVIVRSSAIGEDSESESKAGAYLSLSNIDANNPIALNEAVDEVFSSYASSDLANQVLIQPMLETVRCAGVLFTADLDTLAPYYILSYADDTDTVTSGSSNAYRTYIRLKLNDVAPAEPWFQDLFDTAQVLEDAFKNNKLDIEFALTVSGEIYILQVRPITTTTAEPPVSGEWLSKNLRMIQKKVQKFNLPHLDLAGEGTLFGVMPDWNPAEIVGAKPRPLALSLYRELVTDRVWAYQRHNYGYRNLRSFPLLVSLLGKPYIDVRVSFNSFIPAKLSETIADKLCRHYLDMLRESPSNHDKVEFNVLFTCAYPGYAEDLKRLLKHGFSENEIDRIKFSLLELTNKIPGHLKSDIQRVGELNLRHRRVLDSDMSLIQKIYWLTEDCKRYGTLPFAGLARAGFVAKQFLDAFVRQGILSSAELESFMRSLTTVSGELSGDITAWRAGRMSQAKLLEKYGHLRPGTYDILSPRYDDAFELYFPELQSTETLPLETETHTFSFSEEQKTRISDLLEENGLTLRFEEIDAFIRTAIEGREYGKFVFTRSLSDILRLIGELGERVGLSLDEMSFVQIGTVLNLYSELSHLDLRELFEQEIQRNRSGYQLTSTLKLPALIHEPNDVWHFFNSKTEPNFVTTKRVVAEVLNEADFDEQDLKGKIVAIRSADPGYDWLFSRNIAGLVTEYGGMNSHMAIRSAELGIPAVIGCGEANFKSWAEARFLDLDCSNKTVRVLS